MDEEIKDIIKKPRRYIMLSTLQSTGTWWTIYALKKHPEIGGQTHVQTLISLQNDWVFRDGWTGNIHNDHLAEEGKITLLYCHYGGTPAPANFTQWKAQTNYEFMMMVVPSLAPLRDPLICMIRAWHREPKLYPHNFIMDSWIHVAKRGSDLGMNYWCIDPFDLEGFLSAVRNIGLSTPDEWVSELNINKKENDTPGESDLRVYYANRDADAIEKKLPIPWRRLKEEEPVLRPFLEKYGFKDLLWWS